MLITFWKLCHPACWAPLNVGGPRCFLPSTFCVRPVYTNGVCYAFHVSSEWLRRLFDRSSALFPLADMQRIISGGADPVLRSLLPVLLLHRLVHPAWFLATPILPKADMTPVAAVAASLSSPRSPLAAPKPSPLVAVRAGVKNLFPASPVPLARLASSGIRTAVGSPGTRSRTRSRPSTALAHGTLAPLVALINTKPYVSLVDRLFISYAKVGKQFRHRDRYG